MQVKLVLVCENGENRPDIVFVFFIQPIDQSTPLLSQLEDMLFRLLSAAKSKPDQILFRQARNCNFDRGGSQTSLFRDFRCGQVTLVQKNLKNDKVTEGNSSCSDSALKEVNDGMIGTSKHDPQQEELPSVTLSFLRF